MSAPPETASGRSRSGDRSLRAAWWSLALYPVAFVAAFVVGEGLATWIDGREPGPMTAAEKLAAGLPAIAVFAIPGVCAVVFGLRAHRRGRNEGWYAALLGALVAIGFAGLNLVSFLLVLIFD